MLQARANRPICARQTRRKLLTAFATRSIDPMKPTPTSQRELAPLLAFDAHPDDIEFGCGGVIANETRAGRASRFVVCSRGESASNGSAEQRTTEAEESARILGATVEFIDI